MRKALLIGFRYSKDRKLPGIIIDLYLIYSFLKKNGWRDGEIRILTDIKKDEPTELLKTAILERIVDPNILSFIEDLKYKQNYILFSSQNHYNNFLFSIPDSKNLFFYYSGHSQEGNLILPDRALISLEILRNSFSNSKNVLCIMDCCDKGVELPFELNDKVYRLKDEITKDMFVKSKIILISSSLENEKASTSRNGSFFTRNLIRFLDEKEDLYTLLKKVRKSLISVKQTSNISASFPSLRYIPGFVYSTPLSVKIKRNYLEIKDYK